MGVLKTQSTLTLAVWASILIHLAGFLGFGLAFSNRRESFPGSEPRIVTVLSISSVSKSVAVAENKDISFTGTVPVKIELPSKILEDSDPDELLSDETPVNNKAGEKISAENSDISDNLVESGGLEGFVAMTEPVPVSSIKPNYPFRARKRGLEGVVVLDVVVSKWGETVSCLVIDSSGYNDLDNAAEKTILSSKFYPGTMNGEDVESTLRISIRFLIK